MLLGVDVRLVEQGDFLAPLGQLALDDLLDHVVGLAFFARLLLEDPLFGLALLGGDLIGRHVLGRGRGDVQGDLVGERLEVLVASDEVGLALHFDHRPDLVVGVDVGGDDTLVGAPPFALGSGGLALHPQDLDRPIDVAVGLGQRRLAIHHRRPGPIPQRLHISSRNAHDSPPSFAASSFSAVAASVGAFSSAAGCSGAFSAATGSAGAFSAAGAAGAFSAARAPPGSRSRALRSAGSAALARAQAL